MNLTGLRRGIRSAERRLREARMIARALKSPRRPIMAHIVPIRRCNLSCAYCNEYDDISRPVPTAEMLRRVDRLAALGATAITVSGGEPLLHPELEEIIRRIRSHGILAGLSTNGYLLSPDRIQRLNRAGLDHLQISIDNVMPDEVSKKSLKVLDKKLQWLAEYAEFGVNINSVLGSSGNAEDALQTARRALSLGFTNTVGIIHDHFGQLRALNDEERGVYDELARSSEKSFAGFAYYNHFQKNLVCGLPNDWHCHAGSRYLYICEDGLVHYCSQRRGHPGIALAQYAPEHLEREYHTIKPCAPYCTVSCVHQAAMIDYLREKPLEALGRFFPPRREPGAQADLPTLVRILAWFFLSPKPRGKRRIFGNTVLRLLGVR